MTKVEKLCHLLLTQEGIKVKATDFYRCRPGYWQRSQGAASWIFLEANLRSQYSVTELLKNGFELHGKELYTKESIK